MKRILTLALVVLMALTTVFANGAKEAPAAEKTNTLTVWAWDPNFNIPALLEAEKIYQQKNPDFKLNIVENPSKDIEVKFVTADQAGDYSTLPDIFLMQDNSYQKFIANYSGIFTTLDGSGINFSDFAAGKLAMSTAGGKHYGVPFDNGAVIMPIRTDIIAQAGLTVDDFNGVTWSTFFENATKVKKVTGIDMLTTSGGSEIVLMILQSAGASPYVNGKVNIENNKVLEEAIGIYARLIKEGLMTDYTDWDQYIASFNTGKAAGLIQGNWIISSITAAADQSGKWAVVPLPKLDGVAGATNYSNSGGASWAVSSSCRNKELAFDFLKTTLGSNTDLYDTLLVNNGVITTYMPAAKSARYQDNVEFFGGQKVYSDIVSYANGVPECDFGSYYNDIRSALTDAITNVVQKGADIKSEMKKAQEAVEFAIGG